MAKTAANEDRVNILLVDDQPAKLLAYEVMLKDTGENLLKANSAREALETLLRTEVAIVLMDVSMPELDGFELAAMVRNHPRFQRTAIIFVSAIHFSEVDFLRGYQMGAVDYVSVPVIPEVLRAKVKVFADLYRKTRDLEALNAGLEAHVKERTAALEATAGRLRESEKRRNLALAVGQMGSWDWDVANNDIQWDDGQYAILGVDRATFPITIPNLQRVIHPADWGRLEELVRALSVDQPSCQAEFRIRRPDGELRWCFGTAAATIGDDGKLGRISGVTIDITERRRTEEQQTLLVREVDHRAKNVLAVVQSIVRLSRADTVQGYVAAIEGRIKALSRVHGLLAQSRWEGTDLRRLVEDELSPYATAEGTVAIDGSSLALDPATAQALALALHELSTNAAKYGALAAPGGGVDVTWNTLEGMLSLTWTERGGPAAPRPGSPGFGMKVIERSVDAQLGGRVVFEWGDGGLTCSLTVPLRTSVAVPSEPPMPDPAGAAARFVMLVEDEALVAIMMSDLLSDLGHTVLGPFSSVAQAMEPAATADLSAALLDVTLGRERIYPVAEILQKRGVPFAFLTGYGREGIDPRFGATPVLQKPVDEAVLAAFLADVTGHVPGANGKGGSKGDSATRSPVRAPFRFNAEMDRANGREGEPQAMPASGAPGSGRAARPMRTP